MANIIILNGAARKNGSTAELIKAFTEGAESARWSGSTVRTESGFTASCECTA